MDLQEAIENMVSHKEKQQEALDVLWNAVKSGDKDAKQATTEILFSEVQESFKTHFLPFNNLIRSKKLTHYTSHTIEVKIEHHLLFNTAAPAAVAIEEAHHEALGGFLIQGERIVQGTEIPGVAGHRSVVNPNELWEVLRIMPQRPSCMWAGRAMMGTMMRDAAWKDIFQPNPQELTITKSFFGSALGMRCFTDAFRYDTMQTLDNDEWVVFPVNCETGVEWEWGEVVCAEDHVLFSAEIRIGTVQDDDH